MAEFFIENDLRVFSATAVLAYQKHLIIRCQPVAPVAAGDLDLVPQVDVIILQQLYPPSVGEGLFQIDKEAIEQIEVLNRKIPDPQCVEFRDQLLLNTLEFRFAATFDAFCYHAIPAERVTIRFPAGAALLKPAALFTAVQSAD